MRCRYPLCSSLLLLIALVIPTIVSGAESPFLGRWRLDRTRSSALDGWSAWDLVLSVEGSQVGLRHDMQWGRTQFTATNLIDTAKPNTLPTFFRVEQRHMAVYPAKDQPTSARATWLDGGRTLRIEAETPVETSQGNTTLRLYTEYRLLEGDRELLVIELRSARPRPLTYLFTKVTGEK